MQFRSILLILVASNFSILIVPSAHSQGLPSMSTTVTSTSEMFCPANSDPGMTLDFVGVYWSKCYLASCPGTTWNASPATVYETSTGACNYVSNATVLAGLNVTSQAALAQALGWPNVGAPTFTYGQYIDGPSRSSYVKPYYTSFAAQSTVTVAIIFSGVGVSLTFAIQTPGVTTYTDDRLTCSPNQ